MTFAEVRKAVTAAVISAIGVVSTIYADGTVTNSELIIGLLTVVGATFGVYKAPNAPQAISPVGE